MAHVYHWKHGWIPITPGAAELKTHGDKTEAHKLLVNAEVAKVAAGEKDLKHAKRTIDHAHGYSGKSTGELSDNQLKHEQLRAKDMHRFATGEEDKRTALAHHAEVQKELGSRGHKTGRSAKPDQVKGAQEKLAGPGPKVGDKLHVGTLDKYHGTGTVVEKLDDRNAGHFAVRMDDGPNKGKTGRVAGNQLFKTEGEARSNQGSGSMFGGGIGDLGRLQGANAKKPEHVKPGKLTKGTIVEHPKTGEPVEVGSIHNVIGGSKAAGMGSYVVHDTNGNHIADLSPNSSLKLHRGTPTKAKTAPEKPEHVKAAEQSRAAIDMADARDALARKNRADARESSLVRPEGVTLKADALKSIDLAKSRLSGMPEGEDKASLRRDITDATSLVRRGDHAKAVKKLSRPTSPDPKAKARLEGETKLRNADPAAMSIADLKSEQNQLRSSFQATMMPSGERRLRAVEDELESRGKVATTGAGSAKSGEKLAKAASAEPKVGDRLHGGGRGKYHGEVTVTQKLDDGRYRVRIESGPNKGRTAQVPADQLFKTEAEARGTSSRIKTASAEPKGKKVVGGHSGHDLFDTGTKNEDGNPILELRSEGGKKVGTVEKVTRPSSSFRKGSSASQTEYRITPAGSNRRTTAGFRSRAEATTGLFGLINGKGSKGKA